MRAATFARPRRCGGSLVKEGESPSLAQDAGESRGAASERCPAASEGEARVGEGGRSTSPPLAWTRKARPYRSFRAALSNLLRHAAHGEMSMRVGVAAA